MNNRAQISKDEEFTLPPPLQVKQGEVNPNFVQHSPELKEEKPQDFTIDDDNEAALDAEIQQLERSFHNTQNQLLESEKCIPLKSKRKNAKD